jgi:hypothetical protein
VDDAQPVCGVHGLAGLDDVVDGVLDRNGPGEQPLRQVLTLEVFHHHVGRPGGQPPHVDHAHHVLALDPDGGPRLADEALGELGVIGGRIEQELDRYPLAQLDVLGEHDHAHAPLPQHAFDAKFLGEDVPGLDDLRGAVGHWNIGERLAACAV